MKKNSTLSIVIPLLIIVILIVSCFSISSYTSYVKEKISGLSEVADHSYDNSYEMVLNNYNKALNITLSALDYLALSADTLVEENGSTYLSDFSNITPFINNDSLLPFSVDFMTKGSITTLRSSLDKTSSAYEACTYLIKDGSKPVLFFDNKMNSQGFYIFYPIKNNSYYSTIIAFYPTGTFIKGIFACELQSSGTFSILDSYTDNVYTWNAKDSKIEAYGTNVILSKLNFTDSNMDTNTLRYEIKKKESGDSTTIRMDNDNTDYYFRHTTITHENCVILGLHTFLTLPMYEKYDSYTATQINEHATQLMFIIIGVILIISVIIFILQSYFFNYQAKSTSILELEAKKFKSIMDFTKWHIWEYNYSKRELTCISEPDSIPLSIEQYKNRLITNELILSDDLARFDMLCDKIISGNEAACVSFRILSENNEYRWHEFTSHIIKDTDEKPISAQVVAVDIHDKMVQLEAAKSLSERDSLTGLYNFNTVREHVVDIISDMTSSMMHAMLLIDFDNFKFVNEQYGQTFGDAILIEFASKISSLLDKKNIVGRVGSDKFVIFLFNIPDITFVDEIAKTILELSIFNNYMVESDNNWSITCSVGAALFPNHSDNFDGLVKSCDIATYNVKKKGGNNYCIYDDSLSETHTGNNFLSLIDNSLFDTNNTIIDNDIVFNVVDILFDSKELNASLSIAMSLIGNHYHFDQIGLIEYDTHNNIASCTYSWNSPLFERFAHDITSLSLDVDETYALYKTSENGIFYSNMAGSLPVEPSIITDIVKCSEIQSIFQCAISENGQTTGYIFAHAINSIDWKGRISDTMTLLSRIIAGYLTKQRSQDNVLKLIKTDLLTGSNNLTSFVTQATEIIEENPHTQFAMIYMDINKFKLINDKYGYSIGDQVIIFLSQTISEKLEENEIFARADADKFLIMLKFVGMSNLDTRLMSLFKEFGSLIKNEIGYRASLIAGVYLMHDETNISSAIDRANIARKSIKEHRNTTYEIFNESMKSTLIIKNDIESSMESALENNEFLVYYQPKTNIFNNKICGSEALVRWNRPGTGLISPGVFIPIFEENGFVINIDYFVFEQVCKTLHTLIEQGITVYPVSVNFSRAHFKNNKILKTLEQTTKKYGIDPSLIEVEITESALSEGDNLTPALLNGIKNLGFKLSMDDFGCGLSSLNSLRKFPFDTLKLDKEFFNKEGIGEKEQIVVQNVVNLAKQLNMSIIAEGIETAEQLEFLRSINCPVVQGYVYSPPIPEDKFIEQYLK